MANQISFTQYFLQKYDFFINKLAILLYKTHPNTTSDFCNC